MNQIVSRLAKNKYEEVRFQIKEYKGKDLIDIRIWTDVKGVKDKIPTTKGVTMNVSHFPQLKRSILEMEQALKLNDLLGPETETAAGDPPRDSEISP